MHSFYDIVLQSSNKISVGQVKENERKQREIGHTKEGEVHFEKAILVQDI